MRTSLYGGRLDPRGTATRVDSTSGHVTYVCVISLFKTVMSQKIDLSNILLDLNLKLFPL